MTKLQDFGSLYHKQKQAHSYNIEEHAPVV